MHQGHAESVSFALYGCDAGYADLTPFVDVRGPHLPVSAEVVGTETGIELTFTPQEPGWHDVRVQYGPKHTFQARVFAAVDRRGEQPLFLDSAVRPIAVTANQAIAWRDEKGQGWFQRGALRWPVDWGWGPLASDNVIWATGTHLKRYVDTGVGPPVESPAGGIDVDPPYVLAVNGSHLLAQWDGALHDVFVGDGELVLAKHRWTPPSGALTLAADWSVAWTAAPVAGGSQRCRLDLDSDLDWSCTATDGWPMGFDRGGLWLESLARQDFIHQSLEPDGAGTASVKLPRGKGALGSGVFPDQSGPLVPRRTADSVVLEDWGLPGDGAITDIEPRFIAREVEGGIALWLR